MHFNRRNFVGLSAGLSIFSLTERLKADEVAKEKAVIVVFLGGGSSPTEITNPIPGAPVEYRSVFGAIDTNINGIQISGRLPRLAQRADKLNFIRSFGHNDPNHHTATQWLMTGHQNPNTAEGSKSKYPGFGSIISEIYGPYNKTTGVPTYIRTSKLDGDGNSFLSHPPFDSSGEGIDNLNLRIARERFDERRRLLDNIKNSHSDKELAYSIILGQAYKAFRIEEESTEMQERYGKNQLGQNLLLARRLVERGSKFITVASHGWDNHANIAKDMGPLLDNVDYSLSVLIDDLTARNMQDDVLVVLTGEFGRTPRINATAGRDHWSSLNTLITFGGRYEQGRVIGTTNSKAEYSTSKLFTPIDLERTIFDHLDIDINEQRVDNSGRPRFLLEGESSNVLA